MNSIFKIVFLWLFSAPFLYAEGPTATINVMDYGAKGDGKTLDSKAIQKAIDQAAHLGKGTRVLVPSNRIYLISNLVLKSDIEFHLMGNAQLLVSTDESDYKEEGCLIANGANNLKITGSGSINGRALEFMTHYDSIKEIWMPKKFRPRLLLLTSCKNLIIKDIVLEEAPFWTLHLLGCEEVLIDGIQIKNNLDVPNCDGIDPDHCRNVEIRNCKIRCGDDAIVIKATEQQLDYGPSSNIWVHDCHIETQDSGLKIGTETTGDIHHIVFEDCEIVSSCRGLTIQLRDQGNVYDILFKNIRFLSRYHSNPWWGRGEAISLTAMPRNPGSRIGKIHHVRFENIKGVAENSIRINGSKESSISEISLQNVAVRFSRWTKYPGGVFDNRPTKVYEPIESHLSPGISLRHADNISLIDCRIEWGNNIPDYFSNALHAEESSKIELIRFKGEAANPEKYKAIELGQG